MSVRPRLVDVASKLDLAPSTVSRALNDSHLVAPATRLRVLEAARELGYTVNRAASGLKQGHNFNIGLVAVMNHWYSGAVTSGADRVAAEAGYDFVVVNSAGGDDDELLLERAHRLGTRVDGVLVVDVTSDRGLLEQLIETVRVPVVTMGCTADSSSAVLVDNDEIGAIAGRHLRDLGHVATAALWLAPPSSSAVDNGAVRAQAFAEALTPHPVAMRALSRRNRDDRQRTILEIAEQVSAIFCASDSLAIEAVALLRQAGRTVPGAVSIVGVDDHPLAQPIGLTTIAQEPEEIGARAVELLLELIGPGNKRPGNKRPGTKTPSPAQAQRLMAPIKLVVRQTTDAPVV